MRKVLKIVGEILFMALCVVYLFPVFIIFVNSFKDRSELYENILALPNKLNFEYYIEAMRKMEFLRAFSNSFIVTSVSIAIIIVLSSMTAWMLVRSDNRISRILFMVFVATMLIPFQTLMMPLMQVMGWAGKNLHLQMLDTVGGLIYMNVGFGTSMAVFLYHGFVKSIPISLEEAATIDGCTKFGVFWK
ncbi:MAG: carbohydrate ABC transporter permease, partial [Mobilitalea sp.]